MVRRTLVLLGLIAAFAAGFTAARVSESEEQIPSAEGLEIREGQHGYTNPLLECEIANKRLYSALRPFGSQLGELITSLERGPGLGKIAVYFRDLNNGPWVGYREKKEHVPASLSKVPVVIACFRQAELDPGFLSRTVVYEGLAKERDPGFLNFESNLQRGKTYNVDELILQIAKYSDNAAAELLVRLLPPGLLQRVYFDLGVDPKRLKTMDFALSPKEYGAFFRVLYNASYLSRRFSEQALRSFDQSTFELGLVAGVPAGVPVSHKFGVWENPSPGSGPSLQLHDCGVVYHPARPYLLCVMTTGENYVQMAGAIAAVSRFAYHKVNSHLIRPGSVPPPGSDIDPGIP